MAVLLLGPREPFVETIHVDVEAIRQDPSAYVARHEAAYADIRRGAAKEIVWADPATRGKTDLAVVYLHGFSATKEEVRPLPDDVAAALGANLFFARLAGHGRTGAAMAEATVNDYFNDVAEALEIGRTIGDRVIVMASSSGAALAALAADRGQTTQRVAGYVFVSPNFKPRAAGAELMTLPFAEQIAPAVLGPEQIRPAPTAEAASVWTTEYPTRAALPMAAALKAARAAGYDRATAPALFLFADADAVADQDATRRIAARWAGPATIRAVDPALVGDPAGHVIAGRLLSPDATDALTKFVVGWASTLQGRTDISLDVAAGPETDKEDMRSE